MDWQLETVPVPVADVDRAKRFYSEQVGFAVDLDTTFGNGSRLVQLTPPGSACSIHLTAGLIDTEPGSLKGLQLVVASVETARSELLERGVGVGDVYHFEGGVRLDGPGGRWNSFVSFIDPDGNVWVVQERPTAE
jgi:catechol 2,3-dioxygenase-like lactoylglutathione lyase family enzyme